MNCNNGEQPLCRQEGISYLPPVTPLLALPTCIRFTPRLPLTTNSGRWLLRPCLTLTGTDGALSCSRRDSRLSTFLSPFPQNGFAPRSFSESLRHGTMETLTAARLTPQAALPAYLATSSCRSVSNPVELPGHRYRHASVPSVFRTSP